MQLRGPLLSRELASREGAHLHLSPSTYYVPAIHAAVVVVLGIFALRGSKISVGLLAALMVWYCRGAYGNAVRWSVRGPVEQELAAWDLGSALVYLLLAVSFAIYLAVALVRAKRQSAGFSGEP
jgi:hypothetical protein